MGAAVQVWKETVDRAGVPVLIVDREHNVSYANRAAYEFLDYPEESLTGLSLKWLSPPSCHAELREVAAVFAGEMPRHVPGAALRADGSHVEVTLILEPCLDVHGEVAAVSVRYEQALLEPATTVARFDVPALPYAPPGKVENDQHTDSVGERLDSALQLLRWLALHLTNPRDFAMSDDARERARMLLVLRDATELVHECRRDVAPRSQKAEPSLGGPIRPQV